MTVTARPPPPDQPLLDFEEIALLILGADSDFDLPGTYILCSPDNQERIRLGLSTYLRTQAIALPADVRAWLLGDLPLLREMIPHCIHLAHLLLLLEAYGLNDEKTMECVCGVIGSSIQEYSVLEAFIAHTGDIPNFVYLLLREDIEFLSRALHLYEKEEIQRAVRFYLEEGCELNEGHRYLLETAGMIES